MEHVLDLLHCNLQEVEGDIMRGHVENFKDGGCILLQGWIDFAAQHEFFF
jgi:hypothetical protein